MSRRRKPPPDPSHKYVMLHRWMTSTDAWRDLDCVARCAYLELSGRYGGPGTNNGRLPCSLREIASLLGVSKQTAMRALQRLQDHGFIVLMKQGHFDFKLRHAAEWRLTEFSDDVTGDLPTKDFTRWKKQNPVPPENPYGSTTTPVRVSTWNKGAAQNGGNASPRFHHDTRKARSRFHQRDTVSYQGVVPKEGQSAEQPLASEPTSERSAASGGQHAQPSDDELRASLVRVTGTRRRHGASPRGGA